MRSSSRKVPGSRAAIPWRSHESRLVATWKLRDCDALSNGFSLPSKVQLAMRLQLLDMRIPHAHASRMRKALNITVSEELVARAKALGINVSRAAETGIAEAIRVHRQPGFLKGKVGPVPASFFEPLPGDELSVWET